MNRRASAPLFAMAIPLAALSMFCVSVASAATTLLTEGWHVTQDVHDLGEKLEWFQPDFVAAWQPIDRLAHLQLLLAKQPYFGRELRYFNEHAWWYRLEFPTNDSARVATLRFEGVDYFAEVWLNGILLGEHEGYADPFEFEVGKILRKDRPNALVVKVSSPWDHVYRDELPGDRKFPFFSVERNLLKGSYEHADTFVQRDVNPIGIWRPVKLLFHDELHTSAVPAVTTTLSSDYKSADVKFAWPVLLDGPPRDARLVIHVREQGTGREVAAVSRSLRLKERANALESSTTIRSPKLWTTWDRGAQPLYEATLELARPNAPVLSASVTFGIRSVELHRTANETRFFINGKPIYLRGTTYWPELYLSNIGPGRYERDIKAAIQAGVNALRVHVHTENPEFYELCDRMGVVLLQDNDLNWVFPSTTEFSARAVQHFGTIVGMLKNHPSIIGWIAMNEAGIDPDGKPPHPSDSERALGAQLVAEANRQDPTRPVIEDSIASNDLRSGDRHDYRGSLDPGTYFDIFDSKDKLVTEFGVDAPPGAAALRGLPEVTQRLSNVLPRVAELQDYQYRLLKYYMEHYRIQKYSPNAGYFQFMWIDFSPQSFYGIYDYWGAPKTEGLGGGLRAFKESNQPIGIFLEHDTRPVALYAVNDSLADLGDCTAHWRVSTADGVIVEGSQFVRLGPDGHVKICDFTFEVKPTVTYRVELDLVGANGKILAHNTYMDPFRLQPHPEGHPDRMDDELGMRLWWAGEKH